MLAYDPFSLHAMWYRNWRRHIANAKADPAQQEGYCKAAMISQTMYLCCVTLAVVKEKQQ